MKSSTVTLRRGLCVMLAALSLVTSAAIVAEERAPLFYRNPMNPAVTSPVPAKDAMGMDYTPVYAEDSGKDAAVVSIDPAVVQNLGVRTEAVKRGTFSRRIDTVGTVAYDEHHMSHVHMRAEGWIERLSIHYAGERVQAGAVLFQIYSPTIANAQEELLQALRVGQADLIDASRERLQLLGVDAQQIKALERSRHATARIGVYAPQSGVVTTLNVREGMYVTPDVEVLSLADLSSVWLVADVYERQAAWVAVGQPAEVRVSSRPGEVYQGEVDFIYPSLDPKTRTLRARMRFDNPGEELKPGMYANVQILAAPRENVLSVPRQALIRAGRADRVIVALGEGKFRAAEVVTGTESGDDIEIVSGLQGDERVVVSGQFLIDSEANIKASTLRMQSAAQPDVPPSTKAAAMIGGEGTVTAVMAEHRMLSIDHGPIEALGWPAMTMDFTLTERADLTGVRVGSRIRFTLVPSEPADSGTYRIDSVQVME
ncbi:MAG: efflux RND transporter periplasmic adaptor subunit [Gammaproteobacteria bacterium]|nr:efflux RND transporter periplasmic adaptor subunit [Gammaproteobacteria bacterium]